MVTITARSLAKALPALLLCAAVAALLLLVVSRLLGYHVLAVLSGSMTPTHLVGGAVFVQPLEPDDIAGLAAGDVITFVTADPDTTPITHRIVAVNVDGTFVTKGDASEGLDPDPVMPGQVRGTVVLHVPWLGYASRWLSDTVLTIRLIGVLVLLYVGSDVVRRVKGRSQARQARHPDGAGGGRRARKETRGRNRSSARPSAGPPSIRETSDTETNTARPDHLATRDRAAHLPWWPAAIIVLAIAPAGTASGTTLAGWSIHDTTGGSRLMTGQWQTPAVPQDHPTPASDPTAPDDLTTGKPPTPELPDAEHPHEPPNAEAQTDDQVPTHPPPVTARPSTAARLPSFRSSRLGGHRRLGNPA
jgi:signal peptidase I